MAANNTTSSRSRVGFENAAAVIHTATRWKNMAKTSTSRKYEAEYDKAACGAHRDQRRADAILLYDDLCPGIDVDAAKKKGQIKRIMEAIDADFTRLKVFGDSGLLVRFLEHSTGQTYVRSYADVDWNIPSQLLDRFLEQEKVNEHAKRDIKETPNQASDEVGAGLAMDCAEHDDVTRVNPIGVVSAIVATLCRWVLRKIGY